MTSKYSATQIGANPDHRSPSSESIQTQFKEESKIVLEYMNSKFHPAKKIGHMQVHYPSTADGLGQQRANKLTQDDQKYIPRSLCHDDEERRLNEKINSISEHVTNEFDLNTRKKYQNKQHARASVADKIMTGKLPATKQEYIFPHNASHQQILAQTGTLCMSDPKIRPPPIPTAKRWMGDDVGWV